jgi:hypothetical protein
LHDSVAQPASVIAVSTWLHTAESNSESVVPDGTVSSNADELDVPGTVVLIPSAVQVMELTEAVHVPA